MSKDCDIKAFCLLLTWPRVGSKSLIGDIRKLTECEDRPFKFFDSQLVFCAFFSTVG